MKELELQARRIERLRAAIKHLTNDNRTTFGKRLGYKDGAFVRQMLSGDRAVTEKTIRTIESFPGMQGWFQEAAGVERDGLSSQKSISEGQTSPDSPEIVDVPILDIQQIEDFALELKEAFHTGELTLARFILLKGLLREGRESLAGNFVGEKQAVGGRKREQGKKRHSG